MIIIIVIIIIITITIIKLPLRLKWALRLVSSSQVSFINEVGSRRVEARASSICAAPLAVHSIADSGSSCGQAQAVPAVGPSLAGLAAHDIADDASS